MVNWIQNTTTHENGKSQNNTILKKTENWKSPAAVSNSNLQENITRSNNKKRIEQNDPGFNRSASQKSK
jgi:hypothetical protein